MPFSMFKKTEDSLLVVKKQKIHETVNRRQLQDREAV